MLITRFARPPPCQVPFQQPPHHHHHPLPPSSFAGGVPPAVGFPPGAPGGVAMRFNDVPPPARPPLPMPPRGQFPLGGGPGGGGGRPGPPNLPFTQIPSSASSNQFPPAVPPRPPGIEFNPINNNNHNNNNNQRPSSSEAGRQTPTAMPNQQPRPQR